LVQIAHLQPLYDAENQDRVTRIGNFYRTILQQQTNRVSRSNTMTLPTLRTSKMSGLVERCIQHPSAPSPHLFIARKRAVRANKAIRHRERWPRYRKYPRHQMQQCVRYACLPRIGSFVCIYNSQSSCFSSKKHLITLLARITPCCTLCLHALWAH
jgi:hypothetical protein